MTINIKQNLSTMDKPQIVNCPRCKEHISLSGNEPTVCLFCFKQLPSPAAISTLVISRIGYYEKDQYWY